MECVAFLLTFLFGIFLVLVGILMYFNPTVVRNLIRKAGSSYGTNFLELGPRLLIGLAIIKVVQILKYYIIQWVTSLLFQPL